MLRDAAWCCVMLRDAAWCCVMLCDAVWCCVMLRGAGDCKGQVDWICLVICYCSMIVSVLCLFICCCGNQGVLAACMMRCVAWCCVILRCHACMMCDVYLSCVDAAWMLRGCCVDAAWMLRGCCVDAAWMLRGCCEVLRVGTYRTSHHKESSREKKREDK